MANKALKTLLGVFSLFILTSIFLSSTASASGTLGRLLMYNGLLQNSDEYDIYWEGPYQGGTLFVSMNNDNRRSALDNSNIDFNQYDYIDYESYDSDSYSSNRYGNYPSYSSYNRPVSYGSSAPCYYCGGYSGYSGGYRYGGYGGSYSDSDYERLTAYNYVPRYNYYFGW